MAPQSSIPAWKIPWMEAPRGLQSMGLKEADTTERLHFLSLSDKCLSFSLGDTGEQKGAEVAFTDPDP